MVNDAPDTSRISFTALYTGHFWQKNGLGDPVLDTLAGALLYNTLAPINALMHRFQPGLTLETMLLQRHKLINHLLEQAIEQQGLNQIVEVAAGLSPRGIRFRKKYGQRGLRYVEADLPRMIARKTELLNKGGFLGDDHRAVTCNALATSGPSSLVQIFGDNLDLSQPAAIVSEGLINYFSPQDLVTIWSGFSAALGLCPKGFYFSDIVFALAEQNNTGIVKAFKWGLEIATRGKSHLHFADANSCIVSLLEAGFQQARVHNPQDFVKSLNIPSSQGAALVQVLAAELAKA